MNRRSSLNLAAAAGSGLIFGIGLAVSRMTDPEKVKSFLDVAAMADGNWDASLAFVFGAGLLVAMIFYRFTRPMGSPLFAVSFAWPTKFQIDRPLVIGTGVFGVGWGLSGLCPGPAIAALGLVPGEVALFVIAMLVGSWTVSFFRAARTPTAGGTAAGGVAAK